ncbi:MAG: two-component regulator propeller domain-containing protein [Cytophagaceae bacterium]
MRIPAFRIFLHIVFAFTIVHFCGAQQYNFRNYSIGEGLAQSQVYAVEEDYRGNVWFGTRGGGLSRFDGINFYNYTTDEGLVNNYVNALLCDRQGNLWIGTDNGLSLFDGRKFRSFSAQQGLYSGHINSLAQDSSGLIWIATDKGIFHLEQDTIIRFGRKLGVLSEKTRALFIDSKSCVWAGSDFGAYRFSLSGKEWKADFYTKNEGLAGNIITSISEDSENRIWLCTYGTGVSCMSNGGIKSIYYTDGLASNTVFCSLPGEKGSIWFGTASGISKCTFTGSDFVFSTYTRREGLPNDAVISMNKDSFGDFWFGTPGGGVAKLAAERFVHYTAIKGVLGEWAFSVMQDRAGNMWFATSEGGITRYDGKYYKRFAARDGFNSSKVKCLYEDTSGTLWLGTLSDGVYAFDGKTFKQYSKMNGLASDFINFITSDSFGNIWLATASGGVSCLMPAHDGRYKIRNIRMKDGLKSDRINILYADSSGKIWAGASEGGISRISLHGDSLQIITYTKTNGLPSNTIRSIVEGEKGILYFGTADAGIISYDGKSFGLISKRQGLSSNNIYSLIMDDQKNLWAGSEHGLDKISFDNSHVKSVRHYGRPEGFQGIETIQNSVCKDTSGHLWFGTVSCITRYRPDQDKAIRSPLIHITGIHLFFDRIENTKYGKDIRGEYPLPYALSLPYNMNRLSFDFIGIEQSNPEAVRYTWKMENFDKAWSPPSDKREAVYSNLPPGNYTFRVKACNEAGIWCENPSSYSFTISPPFWETWWFRVLAVFSVAGLSWYFISSRTRKQRKENEKERKRLEMERDLLELEQKALRLQMNPHFLFNCLNSIKGLISENKPEDAKVYLSRFAKLMRIMLENSRNSFVSLEEEMELIRNYTDLEKLSMDKKFQVLIEISEEIESAATGIPPLLIQPFVENSILHGLGPRGGEGYVKIRFSREGDFLKCSIEDNGVGRQESARLKSTKGVSTKSSAIAISQERLNIINKKLNFDQIRIEITDLKDVQGNPSGTMVVLICPYILLT